MLSDLAFELPYAFNLAYDNMTDRVLSTNLVDDFFAFPEKGEDPDLDNRIITALLKRSFASDQPLNTLAADIDYAAAGADEALEAALAHPLAGPATALSLVHRIGMHRRDAVPWARVATAFPYVHLTYAVLTKRRLRRGWRNNGDNTFPRLYAELEQYLPDTRMLEVANSLSSTWSGSEAELIATAQAIVAS